jgi:hypothetical protein
VVAAIEGAIGEPAILAETGETFEALAARTAPVSHLNAISLPDFDLSEVQPCEVRSLQHQALPPA